MTTFENLVAGIMFNAANVKADAAVADELMKKENSFAHRLQQCKNKKMNVMGIVFAGMEPKDVKMTHVRELLFAAGLMNLDGKVITVRPSKEGAKWSNPKSIDGKFTDLKEVLYLLYLAKALVVAGVKFSANTPLRFLLTAEQQATTDIAA